METITLTEAKYRIEIDHDDCLAVSPAVEYNGKHERYKQGYLTSGEVQLHTLSSYGGISHYYADCIELIHKSLFRQLMEFRDFRLFVAAYGDVQEYLNEGGCGDVSAALYDAYSDPESDGEFLEDMLELAKSHGLIHDYHFESQSYGRSYGAVMLCIVLVEGYGSAEGWLKEHGLWASGDVFSASLVCDMVDSKGKVKYEERLASCGWIVVEPYGIEDYIREHFASDLIAESGVSGLNAETIAIECA